MPIRLYLTRSFLALALALFCLTAHAAPKKEEPTINFTIPMDEVPRHLSANDLREWRALKREIAYATANIESGKWMAEQGYSDFVSKAKIDAERKKGTELVKEATERLDTLTKQQNALRVKAEESKEAHKAQFEASKVELTIKPLTLSTATEAPTEAMLYKLWNLNYNKIYFGGAYVFKNGYYAKAIELNNYIAKNIARFDGNRYTFQEEVTEFTLISDNGRPTIEFEEREKMVSKFKPAMLVAELIYDEKSPNGLYALHAIDLKTGKLIEQIILTFPATLEAREMLGTVAASDAPEQKMEPKAETLAVATTEAAPTDEPAKPEVAIEKPESKPVEKTASVSQPEGEALKLTLVDDNNFLGRLGKAKGLYTFDVSYIGQVDGFDQRAAILLNKALMRAHGLQVEDNEFISLALRPSVEDYEPTDEANATWRVAPTSPVKFGVGEYTVQALANQNGQDVSVDIGLLTISATDAGDIPPQAAN